MPTARYTPIPNNTNEETNDAEREMEDAFEGSDDEDNVEPESRPMIRPPPPEPIDTTAGHQRRGSVYNFEYDFPPPGSPPGPSTRAYPNNLFGNSNGYIPATPAVPTFPKQSLFSRLWNRVGGSGSGSAAGRVVGGGSMNDGVFSNVVAKPKPANVQNTQTQVEEGNSNVHIVPEFEDKEAPPVSSFANMALIDC